MTLTPPLSPAAEIELLRRERDQWAAECGQLKQMVTQLVTENERAWKRADDAWEECQARGDILNEIQKEAGGSWWYHALYALRENRRSAQERIREVCRLRAMIERDAAEIDRLRGLVAAVPVAPPAAAEGSVTK